jgi:hypothetical protein
MTPTLTSDELAPPDPLLLGEVAADLVAAEASSAARVLGRERGAEASRLAAAARHGEVPPELLDALADIVAASLKGGRARRLYRAEGEKVLNGVLAKTPAGRAMQNDLAEVNAALSTLAGRPLEGVQVAMRRPGSYTVNLQSEGFSLRLAISADGVTVDSLTA